MVKLELFGYSKPVISLFKNSLIHFVLFCFVLHFVGLSNFAKVDQFAIWSLDQVRVFPGWSRNNFNKTV